MRSLSSTHATSRTCCPLRSVLRHRANLGHLSAKHRQHRHKALDPMPRHVPPVLREVPGGTGRRMLRALVAGERAPRTCATSRDSRRQSSADPLAKALRGMTGPHMSARSPHLSRCMTCRTSTAQPAIRPSSASSAPLLPWSTPTTTPSPPDDRPAAPPTPRTGLCSASPSLPDARRGPPARAWTPSPAGPHRPCRRGPR